MIAMKLSGCCVSAVLMLFIAVLGSSSWNAASGVPGGWKGSGRLGLTNVHPVCLSFSLGLVSCHTGCTELIPITSVVWDQNSILEVLVQFRKVEGRHAHLISLASSFGLSHYAVLFLSYLLHLLEVSWGREWSGENALIATWDLYWGL